MMVSISCHTAVSDSAEGWLKISWLITTAHGEVLEIPNECIGDVRKFINAVAEERKHVEFVIHDKAHILSKESREILRSKGVVVVGQDDHPIEWLLRRWQLIRNYLKRFKRY